MATWPTTVDELIQLQQALGNMTPGRWQPPTTLQRIGACFVCFERTQGAGAVGDAGFAGAAVTHRRHLLAGTSVSGPAGGPYLPLLERAVRALPLVPEVLVVNATGRDHPRRAGLALQLGAVLGLPTVGVTTRPWSPKGPGPATSAAPRPRCGWGASWSAAGSGPGRAPSRWRSMPPGRPTPRPQSRWCWPRPVALAPQSPCAGPAPWPEPGGPAADAAEEEGNAHRAPGTTATAGPDGLCGAQRGGLRRRGRRGGLPDPVWCVVTAEGGRVELGEQVIVMDQAVVRGRQGHPTRIGRQTLVGPHAHVNGAVLGEAVFLATGASVFPGARIGVGAEVRINGVVHVNSVLAAAAVVPIGWVAVGNPAQILPPGPARGPSGRSSRSWTSWARCMGSSRPRPPSSWPRSPAATPRCSAATTTRTGSTVDNHEELAA